MEKYFGITPEPVMKLNALIQPGERLLWSGQPKQGLVFRRINIVMIPFSIIATVVVVGLEFATFKTGSFIFFILCLPFALMALYLLVGRFFYDAWQRSVTVYGVTNKRLLSLKPFFLKLRLYELPIHKIKDINLTHEKDGVATINFNTDLFEELQNKQHDPDFILGNFIPPFFRVTNARYVYDTVNNLLRSEQEQD